MDSPQPMASADGRAMLVFNGEIYNYRELRAELAAGGVTFRTDGDSEVILAAWQKWGEDCLPRLSGMFAFALYDVERRTLLLARDRLGVKPLFMAELADGSLAFASELKALVAHPLLRRTLDPLAVEDYLAWGYVPDHRSILAGVMKLPAGHSLQLRHDTPLPRPRAWWDISFAERRSGKPADLEAELIHLMREAVTSRMVADVPLGAFLSAGVDSSSVVALMAEASASPVKTCSIGFDVQALDESAYARRIAEQFHTDHRARVSPPCLSGGRGPGARDGAGRRAARAVRHAGCALSQGRLGAAPAARENDAAQPRRQQRGGLCRCHLGDGAGPARAALFARVPEAA
jgi:asparagine synthase (glutamine-hydrolysing)